MYSLFFILIVFLALFCLFGWLVDLVCFLTLITVFRLQSSLKGMEKGLIQEKMFAIKNDRKKNVAVSSVETLKMDSTD